MQTTKSIQAGERTHTPGPWNYRQAYSNGEPACLVVHSGADNICDVYPGERITSATEIAEANARLIASAPDLLESAISTGHDIADALLWLDCRESSAAKRLAGIENVLRRNQDKRRAAIEKATAI